MENPWTALPEVAPYVLGMDREAVDRHNARAAAPHRLQLDLMPEPFLGRKDAPVVVLLGNPGYSERDHIWHDRPEFRAAIRETSRTSGRHTHTPFWIQPSLRPVAVFGGRRGFAG